MGRIVATGGDSKAGIGGIEDHDCGTIVINGGKIEATGGTYGAGIGGGECSNGGSITINGGDITATGTRGGAGIGGGQKGSSGVIVINGGTVDTKGKSGFSGVLSYYGPGIGPGDDAHYIDLTINGGTVRADGQPGQASGIGSVYREDVNGTVTINGGEVWARGYSYYNFEKQTESCAAIGAGYRSNAKDLTVNITGGSVELHSLGGAAGIGGGAEGFDFGGEGATVNITGGTVIIETENHAIGAGGNDRVTGALTFGDNMRVSAGSDSDYSLKEPELAEDRVTACRDNTCAIIEECPHHRSTYEMVDQYSHKQYCEYCNTTFESEDHVLDTKGVCTICSYCGPGIAVTFVLDNGVDDPVTFEYEPGTRYGLPETGFTIPEGMMFTGWRMPDGTIRQGGDTYVTGTENMTITATWAEKTRILYYANDGKIQTDNGQDPGIYVDVPKDRQYTIPEYDVFWEDGSKTFMGWYKGDDITSPDSVDTTRIWQPGDKFTPGSELIMKAVWGTYVTFNENDGNSPYRVAVPEGQKVIKPDDPTRNGYVFQGWTLDGALYDFDTIPTGDITLEAGWLMPWQDLQAKIDNAADGATITLSDDLTAESDDEAITVPTGRTVTIDLGGHKIDRARTAKESAGYVILVEGSLTVTDNSEGQTGAITGGWTSGTGGGVYVRGAFTLEGGAITGNRADQAGSQGSDPTGDGSGVYVDGGTFTMNDGAIRDNARCEKNGGGVFVNSGAFTMNGGEISGNSASIGGGVYHNSGTFTMNGGVITGNDAGNGGGVYISGGTFEMKGGALSDNSTSYGGGVFINTAVFDLSGGTISGNTGEGGGVDNFRGTFRLSGSPVIRDNRNASEDDNVYLDDDRVITITGALTNTDPIGVSQENHGVFTSGLSGNGTAANFTSDDGALMIVSTDDGELSFAETLRFGTPDFTLPEDITLIEEYAFEGTDAHIVYIPDGCTEIGPYAFMDCRNLAQIRIPAGCAIGEFAFEGCENVYIFSVSGGGAEQYCALHDNCIFVAE